MFVASVPRGSPFSKQQHESHSLTGAMFPCFGRCQEGHFHPLKVCHYSARRLHYSGYCRSMLPRLPLSRALLLSPRDIGHWFSLVPAHPLSCPGMLAVPRSSISDLLFIVLVCVLQFAPPTMQAMGEYQASNLRIPMYSPEYWLVVSSPKDHWLARASLRKKALNVLAARGSLMAELANSAPALLIVVYDPLLLSTQIHALLM
jgi:hypothetical protein